MSAIGAGGMGEVYRARDPRLNDAAGWQIAKLDAATGQRQPWKTISYPPLPGFGVRELLITPDGNAYAYRYLLQYAHLYTVKGLR